MGNSREIHEYVLCLVVEAGQLILGVATSEMGQHAGKLIGPTGSYWPNHTADQVVRHYCQCDLGITPIRHELVAQKFHRLTNQDHDVLVHVHLVDEYSGLPRDTKRLKDVAPYPLGALPFGRMSSDTRSWMQDVASGKHKLYLVFESSGSNDNALVHKNDLSPIAPV